MNISVHEPDLESNLTDLRGIPFGDLTDPGLEGVAERIMPRDEVSAFNSSI
jgi:hypothetical protein